MPEFLRLLPPDRARSQLIAYVGARRVQAETIETADALRRVAAEDIRAPHPLPEFARTSVDGYAVRAEDTYGASDGLPAYLRLVGEIHMGRPPGFDLASGEAALIHTGGMLPAGANAAVMLEHAQQVGSRESAHELEVRRPSAGDGTPGDGGAEMPSGEIQVLRPVAIGENLISVGEDVAEGQVVVRKGTRLRPPEVGGLMALGITTVRVASRPRVGIISSGDEVVDPHEKATRGQVRDVNTYSLSSMVQESGGEPVHYGIVRDEAHALQTIAAQAALTCDVLLISGGSSASVRDVTADIIQSQGEPGVLVHGINIRPGKPTILGAWGPTAVIGLPGNPVSALVIGYLFVVPVLEHLMGVIKAGPAPYVQARLTVNLPSLAGREDWWPVTLSQSPESSGEWLAEPIFGKSNLIFTLAAATGLVRIPPEVTGLEAGELVHVQVF